MKSDVNLIARYSVWQRFSRAPVILRVYLVFAALATVLAFSPFLAPKLNAVIVPYVGWSGFTFYAISLFSVASACIDHQRKSLLSSMISLLALSVAFGIFDMLWHVFSPSNDFGNPYLTYHPIRPLFTIALPALWILLLVAPSIRKWTNSCDP